MIPKTIWKKFYLNELWFDFGMNWWYIKIISILIKRHGPPKTPKIMTFPNSHPSWWKHDTKIVFWCFLLIKLNRVFHSPQVKWYFSNQKTHIPLVGPVNIPYHGIGKPTQLSAILNYQPGLLGAIPMWMWEPPQVPVKKKTHTQYSPEN